MKKIIAVIALIAAVAQASNTVFQTRFVPIVLSGTNTAWTNTLRAVAVQSVAIIGASSTQGVVTINGATVTNNLPTIIPQAGYGAVTNVQWTFTSAPWTFQNDTWTTTFTNGTLLIGGFVPQ